MSILAVFLGVFTAYFINVNFNSLSPKAAFYLSFSMFVGMVLIELLMKKILTKINK